MKANCRNEVYILGGLRTPFVKAGTHFSHLSALDLGKELLNRLPTGLGLDPGLIEEFWFSSVMLDPSTPNLAREILLKSELPNNIPSHFVSNNCISGLVAIAAATEAVASGRVGLCLAGGAESMSNPTLVYRHKVQKVFRDLFRARSFIERAKLLSRVGVRDFIPPMPLIAEPSTGLSMGQHMEITAQKMQIPRQLQDELALDSHTRAHKAWESGFYDDQVATVSGVAKDLLVRPDTSLQKLTKLPPVFDKSSAGTITAGNSSPLTDGASLVILGNEQAAKQSGLTPLARVAGYDFAAISPNDGLLMAPTVAVPKVLERLDLKLEGFDRFEVHEAFGAQVAANMQSWSTGSDGRAVGEIDRDKLNVNGGSIALGHPFGATGGRIILGAAKELHEQNLKLSLISICAAGAMAGAMVLER